MTCAACAARIEKVPQPRSRREGERQLRHRNRERRLRSALADPAQLVAAVARAGYGASIRPRPGRGPQARPGPQGRRVRGAAARIRRCRVADGSAARPDGADARSGGVFGGAHADVLPRWLQLPLATPVQFWIGRRFYVGAWHALRGGGANMDVLIVLGTTMAYAFSAVVTLLGLARSARLFRGGRRRHHAGAAGQAARGAREGRHVGGDRRAAAAAAEDRAHRARRDVDRGAARGGRRRRSLRRARRAKASRSTASFATALRASTRAC